MAGRPPKYGEASRPVTVTLPQSVIKALHEIDEDRGKAIVKLTQSFISEKEKREPVEMVEMVAQTGILIVGPSASLRKIPFLHMVEVATGRYLLALDPGNSLNKFELALHDALDEVPEDGASERELITQLLANIKRLRKSDRISTAEILFVSMDRR